MLWPTGSRHEENLRAIPGLLLLMAVDTQTFVMNRFHLGFRRCAACLVGSEMCIRDRDFFQAGELRVIRKGAIDLGLRQLQLLPHGNDVLAKTIAIGHELLDGLLDLSLIHI